jgi:arsenate reductase
VIEAMNLIGLDISEATSKSVFDLFRTGRYFDYVITVCDQSAAERCPIFPGITRRLGWSFDDPSGFEGAHEQRLTQVVRVRDEIRGRIELWLKELPNQPRSLRMLDRPSA